MPFTPPLPVSAALVALLTGPACHKSQPAPVIPVVDDDAKAAAGGGGAGPGAGDDGFKEARPRDAKPPLHVRFSARELGDVFAWVKATTSAWNPADPFDVNAQVPAVLLQMGVGPGLWGEINWSGVIAADAQIPLGEDADMADLRAFGTVPTRSARRVIEAIPEGQRPQPLGNGLWELIDERLRVVFREQPTALEFALDVRDLDQAAGLLASSGGGRRIQVVADAIPPGFIDVRDLLGIPGRTSLGKQLDAVSQGLRQLRAEIDVGVGRDLQIQVAADAPFAALGVDALGPARSAPTALEARLWGGPALVLALPWGSAKALHAELDRQVPLAQIPDPFAALARDALTGAHTLLDQLNSDVVVALYLDKSHKVTFVVAAGVRDDVAARAALRGVTGAMIKGLEGYRELAGGAKDAAYKVTYKEGGASVAGAKGDLLGVTVPKNLEREAKEIAYVLTRRSELELVSVVDRGVAIVAIGGGARELVARAPAQSLAGDPGLALARAVTGGCQLCFAFDPIAGSRLNATIRRDGSRDPARAKRDTQLLAELQTVKSLGGVGLGAQLTAERGVFGLGVPQAMLVPDAATAAKLRGLYDRVWDPTFEGEEPPPPTRAGRESARAKE